jgi:hypothetical protein
MSTVSPTLPPPKVMRARRILYVVMYVILHCWAAHEEGGQTILVVNFGPFPGTRTAQREEAIMVLGLGSTTYQNTLCRVLK